MEQQVINVPQELNSITVIPLIKKLDNFLNQTKMCPIELNFNKTRFVFPGGLTPLLAYLKENSATKHTLILNSKNSKVDSYIRRMGFYSLLGLKDNYIWHKLPSMGRFQEPYYFSKYTNPNKVNEKSSNIIDTFIKDRYETNYNLAIDWCINEIIDNAYTHSQSDVNVVMAQRYDSGITEFCVADRGIGIQESMGEPSTQVALEKCITKAKGKQSDGMGNGLFFTSELIKQDTSGKCSMSIWSGNHVLTLYSNENPQIKSVDSFWKGVSISISMYNGISTNITELKGGKYSFSDENMPEYYESLYEN